jgi:hypothetical protein
VLCLLDLVLELRRLGEEPAHAVDAPTGRRPR